MYFTLLLLYFTLLLLYFYCCIYFYPALLYFTLRYLMVGYFTSLYFDFYFTCNLLNLTCALLYFTLTLLYARTHNVVAVRPAPRADSLRIRGIADKTMAIHTRPERVSNRKTNHIVAITESFSNLPLATVTNKKTLYWFRAIGTHPPPIRPS